MVIFYHCTEVEFTSSLFRDSLDKKLVIFAFVNCIFFTLMGSFSFETFLFKTCLFPLVQYFGTLFWDEHTFFGPEEQGFSQLTNILLKGHEKQKYSQFNSSCVIKDDPDYLASNSIETTWSDSKFVYSSTFLCKPVPPHSQPIQICCTTITNMQMEL